MTKHRSSLATITRVASTFLLLMAGAISPLTNAQLPQAAGDPRLVYSRAAPGWLRAVGQLRVPGSKYRDGDHFHHREDCSATLVTRYPGNRADTIVTAWHCLEFYNDLSRPITFTILPGNGQSQDRQAYRLADGGGMHADWAILRLHKPIPVNRATGLLIHPMRADPGRIISMAGYSRDPGKGNNGNDLTFDPACRITRQTPTSSDSNCAAHKGASGGAVVQLSPAGEAQLSGVISQGDSGGLSTFVPISRFRSAIIQHMR